MALAALAWAAGDSSGPPLALLMTLKGFAAASQMKASGCSPTGQLPLLYVKEMTASGPSPNRKRLLEHTEA